MTDPLKGLVPVEGKPGVFENYNGDQVEIIDVRAHWQMEENEILAGAPVDVKFKVLDREHTHPRGNVYLVTGNRDEYEKWRAARMTDEEFQKRYNWQADTRDGATRIADERKRQVDELGWDADHDDDHTDLSLVYAAACFASPVQLFRKSIDHSRETSFVDIWPRRWSREHDRRAVDEKGKLVEPDMRLRIRLLEKAGALIAAEIDRLLRKARR